MRGRLFILVAAVFGGVLIGIMPLRTDGATVGSTAAHAASADPAMLLRTAIGEVLAAAYSDGDSEPETARRLSLRPVLGKYLDVDRLTRRAIGPGWRDFTDEQKRRAIVLFSELVFRTHAGKLGTGKRPAVTYHPAVILAADRQEVPTTITQEQTVVAVAFRFERTEGGWRIYDIVVEGISLLANYRAQFNAIYQKGGAAAVLQALENKLAEQPAEESL